MIMRYHSIKQIACLGLLGAALACPSISRAADYTVHSGWDLFPTVSAVFNNVPFQGVPLGTYNFGSGPIAVGNTDTIIHRSNPIVGSAGGTAGFTATLDVLQLRSVNQVSFGGGPLGYYYVTLQSARGGTATIDTGSMYFAPDNASGTFTDLMDVYFDVRYASLTGPIVLSTDCLMDNTGAEWTHLGSYDPVIEHVNYLLDGTQQEDFWTPYVVHIDPVGNIHIVPEPSGLALLCLGVLCLAIKTRRGRK
jgi:hypothetical protein